MGEQRLEVSRVVALTAGEDDGQCLAATLGSKVHLGGEATAAPAERLVLLLASGNRGMLVRTWDGSINVVILRSKCQAASSSRCNASST